MQLIVVSLVSGMFASVAVTLWPATWQYAPGVIFGAALAGYFAKDVWLAHKHKIVSVTKLVGFVVLSYGAYTVALFEAGWILGTNGFADFSSYDTSSAQPALFVACFVGGTIGALLLCVGIRYLFFKFDMVRGMFLFSICAGMLGSIVAIGFEVTGFVPQFLFPVWNTGMAAMILYLKENLREELSPTNPPSHFAKAGV